MGLRIPGQFAALLLLGAGAACDTVVLPEVTTSVPQITSPVGESAPETPVESKRMIDLTDAGQLTIADVHPACDDSSISQCSLQILTISYPGNRFSVTFDSSDNSVERADVILEFPEYLLLPDAMSSNFQSGRSPDETEAVIESFTSSRIRGSIFGRATQVDVAYNRPQDPNCVTGDIAGRCYDEFILNVPFEIHFDIEVTLTGPPPSPLPPP